MSNPESFIDEVTEEVRRDKLFRLMRRYGWVAVLIVVAIVGGASWNEWRKARETAAAQALGDAIMAAMEQDDAAARAAALSGVEATGEARAVIALMEAGEDLSAGERARALDRLRALADDATLPPAYSHLAALKLVIAEGAAVPVAERRARLQPLAQPGAPYRTLAEEQLALLAAEEGDGDAAIAMLRPLLEDASATPGLRQRAVQLIVALGGTPDGA